LNKSQEENVIIRALDVLGIIIDYGADLMEDDNLSENPYIVKFSSLKGDDLLVEIEKHES